MKVDLFGNTALITSISVELNESGINIVINKESPSSIFHYRGGSINSTSTEQANCFVVFETEFENECEVVLFPENEEERSIMNGMVYSLEDRGQVLVQCIPREKLKFIRNLYSWTENSHKTRPKL